MSTNPPSLQSTPKIPTTTLPVYTCNSCCLMQTTSPPTDPSSTLMRHINTANEHDWLYYFCPRCYKTSCTIDTLEEHMFKCCGGEREDIHRHARQCARWTRYTKCKAGWYVMGKVEEKEPKPMDVELDRAEMEKEEKENRRMEEEMAAAGKRREEQQMSAIDPKLTVKAGPDEQVKPN